MDQIQWNQWYVENIMPHIISHGKMIGLIAATITLVVLVFVIRRIEKRRTREQANNDKVQD